MILAGECSASSERISTLPHLGRWDECRVRIEGVSARGGQILSEFVPTLIELPAAGIFDHCKNIVCNGVCGIAPELYHIS
eukprot:446162-Amphidinium_carterae.1